MAFVKQFLTKTRPSENTCMFRYSPVLPSGQVEIYCLVSISNTVDAETSRFNKFVWDGFLDGFLSKDESAIVRLKNALVASEFKLKELIKNDKVLEKEGVDLNLSVLVFKENKVFVGVLGNHKVFLYKNKLIDLSNLLAENKFEVGSAMVSAKDVIVVFSGGKSLQESMKDFKEVFEFEDFLEEYFNDDVKKGGAFLASLEVEEKEQVVPEPEEEELSEEEEEKEVEEVQEVKKLEIGVGRDVNFLEKKEKFKKYAGLFWAKAKFYFSKIVDFLSRKLSLFFEKLRGSLREKYGRKRWYKKLQSTSSVKKFARGVRPFKVDGYKDKELRTKRFVAFFIILVLVLVVFLGVRSAFEARQKSLIANELVVLMEEWEKDIDSADGKALDESEDALALLSNVSSEVEEFLSDLKEVGSFEKLGSENEALIFEMEERISKVSDKAKRIVGVREKEGNMEVFFDTKINVGSKSDPVDIVISKEYQLARGEKLYIVDAGEKVIYEVSLSDANLRKIEDPKGLVKKPRFLDLSNNSEDDALYVYDLESGVLRAGLDDEGNFNNFESLSGLTPRALGGDDVAAFAVFGPMDSLNFLVPSQSRIVRAVGFGGTTYNLPSEFINHPSFENGNDLFGDQYIYVLSTLPNGIKRFVPATRLNSQLMITGLENDLQSITAGYTGSNMDRALVVFDSQMKRFFQFTKPIEVGENLVHPGEIVLRAQYEYRGGRQDVFDDVSGIVIRNDDKYMYVLDGKKIWKINIEN